MPPTPDPADADHRDMLDAIAQAGAALIRDLTAQDAPATVKAEPFERISRAVRRTIVLARHVAEHPLQPGQATEAARKRIVREIDDAIERRAGRSPRADSLRRELRERIDDASLDLDIVHRPLDQVIAEIRRDLGLDESYGANPWPRRTPEQIRTLNAIAARTAPPTEPGSTEPEPDPEEDDDLAAHDPASLIATLLRPRAVRDG